MVLPANKSVSMERQPEEPLLRKRAVSVETVDCSFTSVTSVDDEGNVTISRFVDGEEGLETPVSGIKFWTRPNSNGVAKILTNSTTANLPTAPPLDKGDNQCIEATLNGIVEDHPFDELQQDAVIANEEGVEMNLNDFQKETKFILLNLKGAEVATKGKKVRFALDEEEAFVYKSTISKLRRRSLLIKLLRDKKKKGKVACPSPVTVTEMSTTETREKLVSPQLQKQRKLAASFLASLITYFPPPMSLAESSSRHGLRSYH